MKAASSAQERRKRWVTIRKSSAFIWGRVFRWSKGSTERAPDSASIVRGEAALLRSLEVKVSTERAPDSASIVRGEAALLRSLEVKVSTERARDSASIVRGEAAL